jgi:ribosome maturation factor RimP
MSLVMNRPGLARRIPQHKDCQRAIGREIDIKPKLKNMDSYRR